jgi:RNA-binding proteins (RRM domain)
MNIFIYGLNFKARKEDLTNLFAPFGEVSAARIILNRETHRSKGYGFVEMPDDEAGKAAIAALDGTQHMDRTIHVAVANPRPERTEEESPRQENQDNQ